MVAGSNDFYVTTLLGKKVNLYTLPKTTRPKTNTSHLKMDGGKTSPSFEEELFSGATVVSGRVIPGT